MTARTLLYFVNTEIHSYIIKQVQGLLLSSTPVHLISPDKGGMRWLYSSHEYPVRVFSVNSVWAVGFYSPHSKKRAISLCSSHVLFLARE